VGRDPDTAAHHQAVHHRQIRLRVAGYAGVEQVLVPQELEGGAAPGPGVGVDRADIPARAQSPLARAGERDPADVVVVGPARELGVDTPDHLVVQGVERLRPVQRDPADSVRDPEQHIGICRTAHQGAPSGPLDQLIHARGRITRQFYMDVHVTSR